MYSCARWTGLRVWKPTTVGHPRSAKRGARRRGVERDAASAAGSMGMRAATRTGPPSDVVPSA